MFTLPLSQPVSKVSLANFGLHMKIHHVIVLHSLVSSLRWTDATTNIFRHTPKLLHVCSSFFLGGGGGGGGGGVTRFRITFTLPSSTFGSSHDSVTKETAESDQILQDNGPTTNPLPA